MSARALQSNLSVNAAAEQIGISPYTLRTWLRQRRLGYVRAGRRVLIPSTEVQRFLERNAVPARERAT